MRYFEQSEIDKNLEYLGNVEFEKITIPLRVLKLQKSYKKYNIKSYNNLPEVKQKKKEYYQKNKDAILLKKAKKYFKDKQKE